MDVEKVFQTASPETVNEMLREGWKLLFVTTTGQNRVLAYVLGKITKKREE